MGGTRWNDADWDLHAAATASKPRAAVFKSTSLHAGLNPAGIKVRESRDSDANPNSTPVILGSDITGSMGKTAEYMIKTGLGVIMGEIYKRKPITDPHICCIAVGDAYSDTSPCQPTQFEAGVDPLVDQLAKVYIEANGGGNGGESYSLAWYFAQHKTSCDAIEKRNRKGYIFTVGDECVHPQLNVDQIERIFGDTVQAHVNTEELLKLVQANWHVYHMIIQPVPDQEVEKKWKALLGDHAIMVEDLNKIGEIVVSIMQIVEGQDQPEDVINSWDGTTALVVRKAVAHLTKGLAEPEVMRV